MMYAFTGTEAQSRWYSIVAENMSPRQESDYVARLNQSPPDYVIECNWHAAIPSTAFDVVFGRDYDRQIFQWIQENYRATGTFGVFRRDRNQPLTALVYRRYKKAGIAAY
jgi:hypothetical protein